MIRMTRRMSFSAAHADWVPQWTEEQNAGAFGGKASDEPYGHNYVLDVGVEGEIDPATGILVNIKEIDRIVRDGVVQRLDRKFISKTITDFYDQPTTCENIARWIADEIAVQLPPSVSLASTRLEETPEYWAEWQAGGRPEEKQLMRITRVYEFAASHRLHSQELSDAENREMFGKCNYENGHGHNYVAEITVKGPIDPRSGRVIDPEALDAVVNCEVIARYDHRHLNFDVPELAGLVPSAEIITVKMWERLCGRIPAPARLDRILLRETARNLFEYWGEDEDDR